MKITALSVLSLAFIHSSLSSASAGEVTAPSGKTPIPATAPTESPWRFSSTSYGWLTDLSGDLAIRGIKVPLDVGMDDILENLDFSYMGYMEVGYNKWSLGLDVAYARLSDDSTFATGPISGAASVELEQAFATGRLQYQVLDTEAIQLDLFTGARWNYYDVDLHVDTPRGDLRRNGGADWFDFIVGARFVAPLSGNWYFQGMGDIGGFGAESDLTWQAAAGIGYRFTPRASVVVGYRAMGTDYDKGEFVLDTVSHGPAIGLTLSF